MQARVADVLRMVDQFDLALRTAPPALVVRADGLYGELYQASSRTRKAMDEIRETMVLGQRKTGARQAKIMKRSTRS